MAAVADQFRSFGFSVGLHLALAALLLVGVDMTRQVVITPESVPVINATAVDQRTLDQELARLRQIEEAAAQAERERLAAIERKAEAERQERLAEQRRIAEARAEKQRQEAAAREAEARRQAEEQARREREAEAQRAREAEEAERKAEQERQRAEREAEAKRLAEREAELKRQAEQAEREEQARLKAQLEQEEAELRKTQQQRRDQTELQRYLSRVERSVMANFRIPAGEGNRVCTLYIKLIPGGDVAEVRVTKSSGSAVFDRQAALAVRKAAPLPVPDDLRLFNKMREIQFVFDPEG